MKSHSMRFACTARKVIQYLERPDADGVFPLVNGVLAFALRNGRDLGFVSSQLPPSWNPKVDVSPGADWASLDTLQRQMCMIPPPKHPHNGAFFIEYIII